MQENTDVGLQQYCRKMACLVSCPIPSSRFKCWSHRPPVLRTL
uniref:Alternative protein LOC100130520 n=1 Tax=Homo sapiens TaxID=9606 RepID=L8E9W2_HUMAN|nr:alternative protein LOC100130520 [Homo sapiens]